jgi:hypothetical protein
MSCRVAMQRMHRMHREGLIALPSPRRKVKPCRSFSRRTVKAEPKPMFEAAVYELEELHLDLVQRQGSALWNE